jgi:SagB-type dehydrogenase family enzyme
MTNNFWSEIGVQQEERERLWELYHQNSKISRWDKGLPLAELQERTLDLIISHRYEEFPKTKLPADLTTLHCSLDEAMKGRITARDMRPVPLSLTDLSTLLYYAYGVTRTNEENDFPHPFRTVPSAGGLFPLEIYFHHNYVEGLDAGLYHYNPMQQEVSHLLRGDQSRRIQELLIQPELAINSSVLIFITAFFERNSFKYGERGYRFAHLEAGHVAQNINLTARGLGLGTVNIGGFLDGKTDEFLRLDGVTCSTLYLAAIGKSVPV